MCRLVEALCSTEQEDAIASAEGILRAMLNGAVALRHARMYPEFAAEAVTDALAHESSIRRKEPKGNV